LIVSFGKILLSPQEQGLFELEVIDDDKKRGESYGNRCGYFPDEIESKRAGNGFDRTRGKNSDK